MRLPGAPSVAFLAYLLILLPWAAFRSARTLNSLRGPAAAKLLPSREAIWTRTLFSQAVLFALAWLVGRGFGLDPFAAGTLRAREYLAASAALGACLALRSVSRVLLPEDERRKMTVYFLAPRTAREWILWTLTVLVASVAEEAAYRGVGMSIVWYSLGSPWASALVCAAAFALAHWTQGWRSAAVIFAMALVMHGLVALSGTLVLAMGVHALYDLIAGYQIGRRAARYDRDAALSEAQAP